MKKVPEPKSEEELEFIDRMTRKIMVGWCNVAAVTTNNFRPYGPTCCNGMTNSIYLQHAKEKGWVAKNGSHILPEGWKIAAQLLKG